MNAIAAYLSKLFADCTVFSRWPEAQDEPNKTISVIRAGGRQDEFIEPQAIRRVDLDAVTAEYVWRVAYCTQPLQLDVWATSDVSRDDIMARLDSALRAGDGPAGLLNRNPEPGLLLRFDPTDGWNGTCYFRFDTPELIETADQVQQSEFRASYRGDAYFELTVKATSPRMAIINLNSLDSGETSELVSSFPNDDTSESY